MGHYSGNFVRLIVVIVLLYELLVLENEHTITAFQATLYSRRFEPSEPCQNTNFKE